MLRLPTVLEWCVLPLTLVHLMLTLLRAVQVCLLQLALMLMVSPTRSGYSYYLCW